MTIKMFFTAAILLTVATAASASIEGQYGCNNSSALRAHSPRVASQLGLPVSVKAGPLPGD